MTDQNHLGQCRHVMTAWISDKSIEQVEKKCITHTNCNPPAAFHTTWYTRLFIEFLTLRRRLINILKCFPCCRSLCKFKTLTGWQFWSLNCIIISESMTMRMTVNDKHRCFFEVASRGTFSKTNVLGLRFSTYSKTWSKVDALLSELPPWRPAAPQI